MKNFSEIVKALEPATDRRSPIAGLGYLKFDGQIATATNGKISARVLIDTSTHAVCPIDLAERIALSSHEVNLAQQDQDLTVEVDGSAFTIKVLDFDSVPTPNFVDPIQTRPLSDLTNLISAISTDQAQYALTGVHLHPRGHAVACDRARLHLILTDQIVDDPVTLPGDLVRSLSEGDLAIVGITALVYAQKTTYSATVLNAKYINYMQILPQDLSATAVFVDPAALRSALSAILAIAPKLPKVNLAIVGSDLEVSISEETAHGKTKCATRVATNDASTFSVNPRYLADAVSGAKIEVGLGWSSGSNFMSVGYDNFFAVIGAAK